jgi:type I restriction enzyme R subunit
MSVTLPKFQEEYSAKIPALTLLHNLGWTFLSPEQALAARIEHRSRLPASV